MADEPESLVLVHLREMRSQLQGITAELLTITAKLEEHDRRFDEHDRRFDENDRRFDGLNMLVNHALGFGATNYVRTREAWQRRADKRLERIERRLDKLEAA
jgi:chromosome segregation ATPase